MEKPNPELSGNRLLYKQIKDYILNNIQNGVYKPGDAIPPERELCKDLNVSRYTVRKGIQELVREGYLYRVQGNGTFVFDKKIKNPATKKTIGVIIPWCDTELEMKFLSGIQTELQNHNYTMTFLSSNDDYKKEAENISILKNQGVQGLIIMPAEDQKDSTAISDLKEEQFPFVLIDRRLHDCETNCVMSDNIQGGYIATEHLIELGHKKIGFIKHESNKTSSVEGRIIGYKKAITEYGLDFEKIFSYKMKQPEEYFIEQIFDFLQDEKPTAVVAVNDYVALDIVKTCRAKNLNLPEDLSIVSFDNLNFVQHLEVPLTSVAQFPKEMGQLAAQLLLEKINTKPGDIKRELIQQILYPTKLIVRDSCLKIE